MFRKVMNKSFPRVILDKIFLLHLLAPLKERTGDKKEIIDNGKFSVLSKAIGDDFIHMINEQEKQFLIHLEITDILW